MTQADQLSRRKKAFLIPLVLAGISALGLALVEGGVSLLLLVADLARLPTLPDRERYTQYDAELGWVSMPNVYLRDMYGPGVWLQTNDRGHRASQSFTPGVPPGRVRLVCSGDSFTLGYGVSNDEAWCQRLGELDPRVEPVNIGQSGYGLGQAYLWYRREGARLAHDIHVFAFIWNDFARISAPTFNGNAKPVLAVRNGNLVVENVPVPRGSYRMPALTAWLLRSRQTASDLRMAELARRVRSRLRNEEERTASMAREEWVVAEKIFDTLAELHRSRGTALVLLHLPSAEDSKYDAARHWEAELRAYSERTGVNYIDLNDALNRLPADSLGGIFGSHLHYSAAGNDWVARELYRHFLRIPEVERLLEKGRG